MLIFKAEIYFLFPAQWQPFCLHVGNVLILHPHTTYDDDISVLEFYNNQWGLGTELSYRYASLCSLAGGYDNPVPTRFLVPTLSPNF